MADRWDEEARNVRIGVLEADREVFPDKAVGVMDRIIGEALRAAHAAGVAEERKRCADIADQHYSVEGIAEKIAATIRAGEREP